MSDLVTTFNHIFQAAVVATGNGTAMSVGGIAAVGVQVAGIVAGDVATFEGTLDDTNWVAVNSQNLNDGSVGTTATADGLYLAPVAGLNQLRCRISAWGGGGTITVVGKGVLNPAGVTLADVILAANSGVDIGDVTVNNAIGAGVYVRTGNNVPDATYIGDIKFGEALPANAGVDIGNTGYKGYTTAKSGQITVTTAGTAVVGTTEAGSLFCIKAHPDNTDAVWVGQDGANDVTNANGFPLNPGETIVLNMANLNQVYFDADVSGEKVCWIKLA